MHSAKLTCVSVAVLACAALASPAHAQTTAAGLTPDQRATMRMDSYFTAPTGVGTYRALSGMGDPNADRTYRDDGSDPDLVPFYVRLIPDSIPEDWRYGGAYWRYRTNSTCRLEYGAQTLRSRMAALGENHPYIGQWLSVQRVVYWPCMHPRGAFRRHNEAIVDGPGPQALPTAMATSDPALARMQSQDRVYQSAAFAFYRGDIAVALGGFQRAGDDAASPHRPIARYMLAAIHAGSRGDEENWQPAPIVPEAQLIEDIDTILGDASLQSVHLLTIRLLGWVRANNNTGVYAQAYTREMLAALHTPIERLRGDAEAKARYDAALADLEYISPRFEDAAWFLRAGPPPEYHVSRALMAAARTDPLAAWALTPASPLRGTYGNAAWALFASSSPPRSPDGDPSWRALQNFSSELAGEGDEAWRVAARGFAHVGESGTCDFVDELAARARAGDDQAAAQLGFAYYDRVRANLTEGAHDRFATRRGFDDAVDCMAAFPFQASNVWRAAAQDGLRHLMSVGRIAEAQRWREATGPGLDRAPGELLLLLAEDEDHLAALLRDDSDAYFYGEGTRFLNLLSSEALWRLAARSDVAHIWRALFARVAWTRSYALGQPIDGEHDRVMRALNPELTAHWISAAGTQAPADDRRLLLDVLASPGLNIVITPHNRGREAGSYGQPGLVAIDTFQHSDNNWWCRWQLERHDENSEAVLVANFMPDRSAFPLASNDGFALRSELGALEHASFVVSQQDRREQEALAQIDCAPKLLTERALNWAAHPGSRSRAQIAEALARAIRSTRWGCQRDGGHGAYSRQAYHVLHRQFPGTEAARRTRNWFDCQHFSGGCPEQAPQ